jgi:hypothetical protein
MFDIKIWIKQIFLLHLINRSRKIEITETKFLFEPNERIYFIKRNEGTASIYRYVL